MFFVKKMISAFLLPLPIALGLLGVGLALLWFSHRQKAGRLLATIGFGLLLLSSLDFVADGLLGALEDRYPPLYPSERLDAACASARRRPEWIVVLGAGNSLDDGLPPADMLSPPAVERLAEAVRLHRELPGTRLLVSGGSNGTLRHADLLASVAETWGVNPANIVRESPSLDTVDEALNVTRRLGQDPFVLVTSASHMPRAMALFQHLGADPIAATTNHIKNRGLHFGDFLPAASAGVSVNVAVHEYLGLLWSKLRRQI